VYGNESEWKVIERKTDYEQKWRHAGLTTSCHGDARTRTWALDQKLERCVSRNTDTVIRPGWLTISLQLLPFSHLHETIIAMPPKRPLDTLPSTPKKTKSDSDTTSPPTPSPKKTSSSWSASEEKKFLEKIDKIVKSNIWAELKFDDEVGKRGANGVRSHWDAMVSLLSSICFMVPPVSSFMRCVWMLILVQEDEQKLKD